MSIIAPVVSSRWFTLSSTGTLVAEISELSFDGRTFWGQAFDDACDIGFQMRSERTGNVKLFILDECRIDRDAEGDIHGWWFVEYRRDGSKGLEVLVIND